LLALFRRFSLGARRHVEEVLQLLTLCGRLALSTSRDVEEILELFTLGCRVTYISIRVHIFI
jgi:transposase